MSNENLYSSELFQSTVMTKSYYQILQDSNLIESQVLQPVYQMTTSQYMTQSLKPKVTNKFDLFHQLDEEHDSEDEGIEDYKIGGYHPVHVGEVLVNRYVTIQKLGWGHFSTVWLSKDFKYNTYVAIKVQKSAENYLEAAYDEVEILQKVAQNVHSKEWVEKLKTYKQTNKITRDDSHVVQLLNSFVYKGPYGSHFCMVFEILGVNLLEVIKRYEFKGIPINLCKKIAKEVLIGLQFLHEVCGVIHTDLKPENVLLQLSKEEIEDIIDNGQLTKNQIFKDRLEVYHKLLGIQEPRATTNDDSCQTTETQIHIETKKLTKTQKRKLQRKQNKQKKQQQENSQQIPEIQHQSSIVEIKQEYPQQINIFQLNKEKISFKQTKSDFSIKVADLGNACWTHHQFSTLIQTRQYRSPEVLIGSKYNCSADLWSFACMIFELLTGDFLFEPRKGGNFSKNDDHLAQIQELVGKFPLKFSQRGLKSKRYFNKDGNLHRIPVLNCWSLKNVLIEKYKFKLEEAQQLSDFLLPMLNPYPEKRATAGSSLLSKWLQINDTPHKMNEEEFKTYQETKEVIEFVRDVETEEEYADRSSSPKRFTIPLWKKERAQKVHKQMRRIEPRQIDRKLLDRSFTDLGYVGFGDGIDEIGNL
ncbi:hypothetical protein pb186bvf_000172 [Paramecium bursaria]